MKLTNGIGRVFTVFVVLSASACVGVYDTGPSGTTPTYGNAYADPQVTPPAVFADYCGIVSGYSVPGTSVAIYDDATCSDTPLATTLTDPSGFFEVSVCATAPSVNARSFDEYGQGSVCSSELWVEDPATAW